MSKPRKQPCYIYVERLRCPECLKVDLKTQRSEDAGEGMRTRWMKCVACGFCFRLVICDSLQDLDSPHRSSGTIGL
jgi:hypothetical protein